MSNPTSTELAAERVALRAQLAKNKQLTAEQRRVERAESQRIENERALATLNEKDYEWNSSFPKSHYVLGAQQIDSAEGVGVLFTVSEWASDREEVAVSGDDLIALRDYLNRITNYTK